MLLNIPILFCADLKSKFDMKAAIEGSRKIKGNYCQRRLAFSKRWRTAKIVDRRIPLSATNPKNSQ